MRRTTSGRQITYVWGLLSALTILSWWLGAESSGHLDRDVTVTVVVLALALTKVRFVLRTFMEVRTAPRWLRRGTDVWLLALGASVLALYLA